MQLTIIGAGAIGGTIGARLIRGGHDVLLCDADTAHVGAINRRGLSIEGPVENFTVAARAVTPDGLPGSLGRVAIAVKSHHTAQAAALLPGRLDPQAYVVSFQNGLTVDAHHRRDRTRAAGRQLREFRRRPAGARTDHAGQRGHVPGRRAGGRRDHAAGRGAGPGPALRRAHRQHHGLPVGQGGLRRDAVRGGSVAPADRRDPGGPALAAADAGYRPGGAGPGPGGSGGLRRVRA